MFQSLNFYFYLKKNIQMSNFDFNSLTNWFHHLCIFPTLVQFLGILPSHESVGLLALCLFLFCFFFSRPGLN